MTTQSRIIELKKRINEQTEVSFFAYDPDSRLRAEQKLRLLVKQLNVLEMRQQLLQNQLEDVL